MPRYIEMPKLSDTMTEGRVVKWRKTAGDQIEAGDVLAEIETDKAVMDMEAFDDGVLGEILVPEGESAKIGQRLASFSTNGGGSGQEEGAETNTPSAGEMKEQQEVGKETAQAKQAPAETSSQPAPAREGGEQTRVKASPLAKKIASSKGVNLAELKGSGPGGRIVAKDVEGKGGKGAPAAQRQESKGKAAPAQSKPAEGTVRRIPVTGVRKIIADRLLASKTQVPHFYLHLEADLAELMQLRTMLNKAGEQNKMGKITINDFVIKAVAMAASRVPQVNASFNQTEIVEYSNVDVAVAVAIEDGLITPVVRQADQLSLREISESMKDLAERARQRKLRPEEFQGGTITISNLGSYGIESFDAIINQPGSMIVSVGALIRKPVVNADNQIVVGQRMDVGISADHRVVDGAVGAQFLSELRKILETPATMLL